MGWTTQTFTFTAHWETTILSFQSLTFGSGAGPALDNVQVTKVAAKAPYLLPLLLD